MATADGKFGLGRLDGGDLRIYQYTKDRIYEIRERVNKSSVISYPLLEPEDHDRIKCEIREIL